jgi:hypothetical protein
LALLAFACVDFAALLTAVPRDALVVDFGGILEHYNMDLLVIIQQEK